MTPSPDSESVAIAVTRHDGRLNTLESQIKYLMEESRVIADLRVEIGKLQTQIKVTWVLLILVISGLVGVAFASWGA